MGSRFHAIVARRKACALMVAAIWILMFGVAHAEPPHTSTSTSLSVTSGGVAVATVPAGSLIKLTATVKATTGAVTFGQVEFCDAAVTYCTDIHQLGLAQLSSAGVATLLLIPRVGVHSYKAVFRGTTVFAAAASTASSLTVSGGSTTTTAIAASGGAGSYTLSATVTGTKGVVVPTGTVSFQDTTNANYVLAAAGLAAGAVTSTLLDSTLPATGTSVRSVATGDFNLDGVPDIAVSNSAGNTVTILLGNGDGTFRTVTPSVVTASAPGSMAVGDFNEDGIPDIAVNTGSGSMTILLGKGDGTFTAAPNPVGLFAESWTVSIGDFNGDGHADLAVGSDQNYVTVMLGNGAGGFTASYLSLPSTFGARMTVAGDFNGDGLTDLAIAPGGAGNPLLIYLSNGDGTFTAAPSLTAGGYPIDAVTGDFNGDGILDIAVCNDGYSTVTILLGKGDGTFVQQPEYIPVGNVPIAMAVGDVNGDGIADVAISDELSNNAVVLYGKGDGTFPTQANYTVGSGPYGGVAAADFNGDGYADLVVANNTSGNVTLLLSQLSATATASVNGISPVGMGSHYVDASYGGDSYYGPSVSSTTPLTAEPVATALTLTQSTASSTYGQQVNLTALVSPNLAQNHSAGSSVTFYDNGSSIGTGAVSGGVAALNLTTLPIGLDSLTATYVGDTNFVGSTASAVIHTVQPTGLTEPVGSTSALQSALVTFTASGTLGAIAVLTQGAPNLDYAFVGGGTCVIGTSYTAGQSCTVEYTFTPMHPGMRYGGVTLTSAGGVLGSVYLSGTGTGPQIVYGSVTKSSVGNGFNAPSSVVVDGLGNLFVADYGNNEVKEILAAGGYQTVAVLGGSNSTFSRPYAIAIDGNGNLFVTVCCNANSGLKEIVAAGGYNTVRTLATFSTGSGSFNFNGGVAVDQNGNVFVADSNSDSVVELLASQGYSTLNRLNYTFSGPLSIAVDPLGDLFVVNQKSGDSLQEVIAVNGSVSLTSPTVVTVDGTFNTADGVYVATDGNGDVYVASEDAIQEILAVNGSIPAGTPALITLYSKLEVPGGLAIDGSGTIFIVNAGQYQVLELNFSNPPTLSFATTAVGSTSVDSPQTVTISNNGNAALSFTVPGTGFNPTITAGFTIGAGSTCPQVTTTSNVAMLAAGATCSYAVNFTPVITGGDNGHMTLTDNNLDIVGALQQIPLNGTGTGGPPPPVVSSVMPNSGPDTGGTVVTITGLHLTGATAVMFASLAATNVVVNSDTSITATSPAPGYQGVVDVTVTTPSGTSGTSSADYFTYTVSSQTITFPQPAAPAYAFTAVLFAATSSSGLPVTYKVISGPAVLGTTGVVLTGVGTVVMEADQAGNAVYAAATPVQISFNVLPVSVAVGSTNAALFGVVTMSTPGMMSKFAFLTQGAPNLDFNFEQTGSVDSVLPASCSTTHVYAIGDQCILSFSFSPLRPGIRYGGITVTTSSGSLLGSGYIVGVGTGPQVTWGPAAQSTLGSGFIKPAGVAIDGKGNVFVADAYNGVKEVTASSGYTAVIQVGSGFVDPTAVALDGNGNLFVSDLIANTVTEVVAVGGYSSMVRLAPGYSSFSEPDGVAVDGAGNVFVINYTGNQVNEILAAGGYNTVTTLGGTFNAATGIAVDRSGNVFVASSFTSSIQEIPYAAGSYGAVKSLYSSPSGVTGLALDGEGNLFFPDEDRSVYELTSASGYATLTTISNGFVFPDAVAVDGSGNVYVAQHGVPSVIKLDYSDPPSLTFATTAIGQTSTDSPQSVTLMNDGNAELNFTAPVSGANPSISTGFSFTSSCPILQAGNPVVYGIGPGASCTNAVSFKPVMAGSVTGDLVLTDNNLNATNAMQKVPLNGIGTSALIATTSALTVTPAGPYTAGETITLTGTITAAASAGTPISGTVTFYDNGVDIGQAPVTAGGVATLAFTVAAGSNALGCLYSGDANYLAGACNGDIISASSAQTITFSPPGQALAGTSVLLTATGGASGNPVVFSVVSGPAMVSGTNGQILTYTGPGSVVIEADQAGNSSYAPAPTVQATVNAALLTAAVGGTVGPYYTYVTFSAAGTLANLNVFTQGLAGYDFQPGTGAGACAIGTTYSVGQYCQIWFQFTPSHPGLRYGGTPLTAADGTLLANSYIYGLGQGPQITWTPGNQSSIGSGFTAPVGVSVDISGNVFVADMGASEVYEIPAGGGAVRTLGAFLAPDDVTVDGSGNVFVIWGNNRNALSEIMAVNGVIPATPVIRTITTTLSGLDGAKVDGNGNVFLAQGYVSTSGSPGAVLEVVAVNGSIPATPTIRTLGSGFSVPTGVAVDPYGDVFVADQSNSSALEILAVNGVIPASPTIVKVGSGFAQPSNIALDAAGDVFVTDAGPPLAVPPAGYVYEIFAVNGVVPSNPTIITLGIGTESPQGTIVDQYGDVYIADEDLTQIIKLDYTTPPTLTFADTLVGQTSTDSPQTVTIANDGNEPLTFLVAGGQPFDPVITAGFADASSSTCLRNSASSLNAPLLPGQSCTDLVNFTPVAAGIDSGTLTTYDNNLGVSSSSQIVYLNGKGRGVTPTLTFTVPDHVDTDPPFMVAAVSNSPGAITYTVQSGPATVAGNLVTLTGVSGVVTMQASQAASGAYLAATATATFQVTKAPQTITFTAPASPVPPSVPPIMLMATASSGLPVTFSVLSGPATVSGNMLTITGPCANVVVAADQAGNATYAAAPEVTHTIAVTGCTASLTLTSTPNPVFLLNPVTFTATLAFTAGTPTGTVQFLDGTTPIGSSAVDNGAAIMTTSTLSLGAHTITAVYGGDTNFAKSTSNSVVELVEDFSLTITNPVLTISHGGTATYDLVVTTIGGTGMAATVSLTMSGAPDNSKITFTPASVATGSGTTNVSLVIATPDYPVGPWGEASAGVVGLGALLLMLRRKRRRLGGAALVFAASLMLGAMSGCGWGWGPQHFALTVTAQSGPLVRTATARLTSQ